MDRAIKFLKRLTVAVLLSGLVDCAHAPPKYAHTYPPEIAASLKDDCVAETGLPRVCSCYQRGVMDRWSFGRISMMVAVDRDGMERLMYEVYYACWVRQNQEE